MTRREFLKTLSLAIGASAIVNSSRAGVASRKPNIIFIFADDHASEAISAYGSYLKDYAKTPNIDRLAKELSQSSVDIDRAIQPQERCARAQWDD